ncbi:hypothetical protein M3J09_007828 [Ascochyta lentis]
MNQTGPSSMRTGDPQATRDWIEGQAASS